jgi:hypothetical protein
LTPGVNVILLFSSLQMTRLIKLEFLYLAITFQSSLTPRAGPRWKHLKGSPIGFALALPSNSKTRLESVTKGKPSSLLVLVISDEGKSFLAWTPAERHRLFRSRTARTRSGTAVQADGLRSSRLRVSLSEVPTTSSSRSEVVWTDGRTFGLDASFRRRRPSSLESVPHDQTAVNIINCFLPLTLRQSKLECLSAESLRKGKSQQLAPLRSHQLSLWGGQPPYRAFPFPVLSLVSVFQTYMQWSSKCTHSFW